MRDFLFQYLADSLYDIGSEKRDSMKPIKIWIATSKPVAADPPTPQPPGDGCRREDPAPE